MKTTLCHVCCCIAAALITAFPLASCTTDAYDKGNNDYSMLEAEMADIHVGKDLKADYLTTDDGKHLAITFPFTSNWMKTPDSTYRAMTYFTRNNAGVEVAAVNRVAVTMPRPMDDLKTDPVRFESLWVSSNGIYLNTCIYMMVGTTDDENAIQTLGCQKDSIRNNSDGTTTQLLTLYHDQGGVPEYYSRRTYISIPLYGINTDSLCLSVNTYKGIRTYSVPR